MQLIPLSDRRITVLFLISWILLASIQVYSILNAGFTWKDALTDAITTNILLFITCLIVSNSLRYYRPATRTTLYLLSICLIYTSIALLINHHLLAYLLDNRSEYLTFVSQTLPLRSGVAFLIICWMTFVNVLWQSLQERMEEDKRKADTETLAREAELYKLRQQLQPHFLFNSLNSISALIGSRPGEARQMIYQLSDFLRGTLKKEENQWVSLAEELQHLQLYLSIEKVRFGHRLNTEIECVSACSELQLPPLLLQPIVENAIKFGLYDVIGTVTITIKASIIDNILEIEVKNPFDPETTPPRSGTGFGLSSIKRRLYLLFARNDLLQTHTTQNIFTTLIRIPQP